MTGPLLTIGLLHGNLDGNVARIKIADGQKILGQCYVTAADLAKCLAGRVVPCVLTHDEVEKLEPPR